MRFNLKFKLDAEIDKVSEVCYIIAPGIIDPFVEGIFKYPGI